MAGNKTYRTASGQQIDLQKLALQNETVRAVGNMNVNARGDVLDNNNKATASRSAQVNKSYRKQIGNVAKDLPVPTSKKAAQGVAEQYVKSSSETKVTVDDMITGLDTAEDATLETAPAGGLAAAIAKAREVKQEPQPTPREEERSGSGVRKI